MSEIQINKLKCFCLKFTFTTEDLETTTQEAETTEIPEVPMITEVPSTTESLFPIVHCRYYYDKDDVYTCELSNILFRYVDDSFTISGTHKTGRNNTDVAKVVFIASELLKVPTLIFNTFNNLSHLDINDVGLKAIHRKTFES